MLFLIPLLTVFTSINILVQKPWASFNVSPLSSPVASRAFGGNEQVGLVCSPIRFVPGAPIRGALFTNTPSPTVTSTGTIETVTVTLVPTPLPTPPPPPVVSFEQSTLNWYILYLFGCIG